MIDTGSCVEFLRRLMRTASLPGKEGGVARLVREEMARLRYDTVRVDNAGNVIGTVLGRGATAPLLFNAHLDHVDVGDPERWPSPPFAAELRGDEVWGRGAVDIKGPLAAQVYALGSLVAEGVRPPGDVHVAAVVQEEIGGAGSRFLASYLTAPVVIIGEPSSNQLERGHRGRLELLAHFVGRSAHASVPDAGRNPLESAAAFLLQLRGLHMASHETLGPSTVAPTSVRTDQTSLNVIPGEAWVTCDWRHVPAESDIEIRDRVQRIAEESCIEGTSVEVTVPSIGIRTYTGHATSYPAHIPGFLTAREHPVTQAAQSALRDSIALSEPVGIYHFATDGGIFAPHAQAVLGFGPGNGRLAHTVDERIGIAELETGVRGNRALALAGLPGARS